MAVLEAGRSRHIESASVRQALGPLAEALSRAAPDTVRLVVGDLDQPLPSPVVEALGELIARMAKGDGVVIATTDQLLTTTQAAEVLGVSRAYLCRLLDNKDIPHVRRGTHRRVRLADVLTFSDGFRTRRKAALDEIAAISKENELYEDDF